MSYIAANSRNGSIRHIVSEREWREKSSGARALCGAKTPYAEPNRTMSGAAGAQQPVGTCKRCAAALGQTVRPLS